MGRAGAGGCDGEHVSDRESHDFTRGSSPVASRFSAGTTTIIGRRPSLGSTEMSRGVTVMSRRFAAPGPWCVQESDDGGSSIHAQSTYDVFHR